LLTLASASTAIAQESRATITGTVFDQQGGAIPGATVTVKQLATNGERTTTTNDSGQYVLPF
jgi:protocatechuate 3,4-dioxygenase beta subunit